MAAQLAAAAGGAGGAGPGMSEEAFKQLLLQANRGETAAVLAAVDQDRRLAVRASLDEVETLLQRSCFGWDEDNKPLPFDRGHLELARGLLERGSILLAKDSSGADAGYWASAWGHEALLAFLLDKGADPNTRVTFGYTCISAAASTDDLSIVLQLIAKGGDFMASGALKMWGIFFGEESDVDESDPDDDRYAKRKAIATEAWLEGPHPSQVKRRADERWARRWPFMQVAVGHGFRPLAHQQALLAAAALPHSVQIPSLTAPRPALLRDKVFTDEPLFKRIMSYV